MFLFLATGKETQVSRVTRVETFLEFLAKEMMEGLQAGGQGAYHHGVEPLVHAIIANHPAGRVLAISLPITGSKLT